MSDQIPQVHDEIKILACIGHVCLQWSLLETNILALIAAAENAEAEKVFLMFGGLDIQPRCGMAINLARHHKWPPHLIKRIENIRKALQRNGKNIAERRNQAIHGVHSLSDKPGHVKLTMVRWKGEKRQKDVSISDLHALGTDIHDLSQEAISIFDAYGVWKFGKHSPENLNGEIAERDTSVWLKFTQYIKTSINHFRRGK